MIELKNAEAYAEAIKEGKSIIYFTTTWCPDCFIIKPHLKGLEEKYDAYTWYQVDRDDMLDLCQHLGILGIPSFLAYENGAEIGRFVSRMRKTKEEVEAFIDAL